MGINPNGGKKKSSKKNKRNISVDETNSEGESSTLAESSKKIKKTSSSKKGKERELYVVSDDDGEYNDIKVWDKEKKKSKKKRKEKESDTKSFFDDEDDTIDELDDDSHVWDQFDTEIIKKKSEKEDKIKKRKIDDTRKEDKGTIPLEVNRKFLPQEKRLTITHQSNKQTDESFTAIKRTPAPKIILTPTVDIDKLIDSVKRPKPLSLSKYPEPPPTQTTKFRLTYKNYPQTSTTPSSLPAPQLSRPFVPLARPLLSQPRPPLSQQQSRPRPHPSSSFSPSTPSPPPPPPPTPPSPPPPPPPQSPPPLRKQQHSPVHIPTHHGNRNHPASTSGQAERLDPRIRARDVPIHNVTPSTQTRKDPRRTADNVDRIKLFNSTAYPTPFVLNTSLYSGTRLVASVILEGRQSCYHEAQIRELILSTSNNKNEIRSNYTVPLKVLDTILLGRSVSFMSITPRDKFIELSKLKSFYQVNEISGVVLHPDTKQALVLLAEEDIKKLSNLPSDTSYNYTSLCAVFIDNIIPRPKALSKIVYDTDSMESTTPYQWNFVIDYLKFPDQLKQLKTKSKFLAYGSSDASAVLVKAISLLKNVQSSSTSYVMMFDRYNETYFSRNLTKHKKEAATQIWEYGVPNYSYKEILPAAEIFPNHSGGFVTTDMENIAHNPAIIDIIKKEIIRLNALPTVYGEWKFILPHNWIKLLKNTIKDQVSGQRAKNAMVALVLALSTDTIRILKLWSGDSDELNNLQYLNRIAHNKYKTHQYFVYVDDISSVPSSQHMFSIDFVKSDRIYSTFS